LLDRHPLIAGVLFGLTSFKPQFALLVPLARISAARWRCLLAAAQPSSRWC
jgi:alpha-1,2-mannosyltransferase